MTPRKLGEGDKDRIIHRSDTVHPCHQVNFRSAELATSLSLTTSQSLIRCSDNPDRWTDPSCLALPCPKST